METDGIFAFLNLFILDSPAVQKYAEQSQQALKYLILFW